MKKKIFIVSLLSVLLILGTLVLTGCDSKNQSSTKESTLHKISFMELKYDEVKNFSRKENTLDWEDNKVLNYFFAEDDQKSIKLIWYKNKDQSFVIYNKDKCEEKTINNINWTIERSTDFGITYDTYSTVHNGDLYVIELNCVDKYQKEFDEFIKTVEF